jgi:RNA polymerase sigma-70 factor (ECF subfamily)
MQRRQNQSEAGTELALSVPSGLAVQQGQGTLKLEEQIVKLFDELRVPVYRYLLCTNVTPEEAEEIIQESFLRLFKHLHAKGREDNLRGWVFRVAHNIALVQHRGRKHLTPKSPEEWVELSEQRTDSAPNPEELLLRKEKIARVHAAMSGLSNQQLQCVLLRAEGFRYREIAEILGVTVSTIGESLRRAIEKLARERNE